MGLLYLYFYLWFNCKHAAGPVGISLAPLLVWNAAKLHVLLACDAMRPRTNLPTFRDSQHENNDTILFRSSRQHVPLTFCTFLSDLKAYIPNNLKYKITFLPHRKHALKRHKQGTYLWIKVYVMTLTILLHCPLVSWWRQKRPEHVAEVKYQMFLWPTHVYRFGCIILQNWCTR